MPPSLAGAAPAAAAPAERSAQAWRQALVFVWRAAPSPQRIRANSAAQRRASIPCTCLARLRAPWWSLQPRLAASLRLGEEEAAPCSGCSRTKGPCPIRLRLHSPERRVVQASRLLFMVPLAVRAAWALHTGGRTPPLTCRRWSHCWLGGSCLLLAHAVLMRTASTSAEGGGSPSRCRQQGEHACVHDGSTLRHSSRAAPSARALPPPCPILLLAGAGDLPKQLGGSALPSNSSDTHRLLPGSEPPCCWPAAAPCPLPRPAWPDLPPLCPPPPGVGLPPALPCIS